MNVPLTPYETSIIIQHYHSQGTLPVLSKG